jgi:hypothetical protein
MSREENPHAVHELHNVIIAVSTLKKKLLHLQERVRVKVILCSGILEQLRNS